MKARGIPTRPGGQIEPRPLDHLVEDLSPTVVVAELNHPPKNSVVRSEAEDRVAQHLIEECIRFRMIVLHDEMPGLRQIILIDMDIIRCSQYVWPSAWVVLVVRSWRGMKRL